jgi:hypothetical protein
MLCRKEKRKQKERKEVNYRIEICRRVLISAPLYQVGAGTFVTKRLLLTNYTLIKVTTGTITF